MVSLHLRSNLSCTLLYLLSVLQVSVQAQATHRSYSVKIINPRNAGGQCVESWSAEEFSSVDDIKSRLCEDFSDYIMENSVKFGYIVPGHGLKGKQMVIETDDDLPAMYNCYRGKRCVMLWVKCVKERALKRLLSSSLGDSDGPKTKRVSPGYTSHMKNMAEVEEILERLKQKHKDNYTPEQLHAWAHMIQMKKHSSYDTAPNKPFFGKKGISSVAAGGISPLKKINMRSECIQQLSQWHQLMEKGAITVEEYKEMQETILQDIKRP